MTVERFKYSEVNDSWDLQLDDDGDYVDYFDYLKLEAETKDLHLVRGRLLELLEDAKADALVAATSYENLEAKNETYANLSCEDANEILKLQEMNEQLVYEARALRTIIDDLAARYGQQSLDNLLSISSLARSE